MSEIRISARMGGTTIDVDESTHPLSDDAPKLLGIAVRRVCDAMGGDRMNTITAVAQAMGVHVEWVE